MYTHSVTWGGVYTHSGAEEVVCTLTQGLWSSVYTHSGAAGTACALTQELQGQCVRSLSGCGGGVYAQWLSCVDGSQRVPRSLAEV